jgi:uncharacterized protein (DUF2345 family)
MESIAEHAQRHHGQTNNHGQSTAHGARNNPCNDNKEEIQPEQTSHETRGNKLRQAALQIVDPAD